MKGLEYLNLATEHNIFKNIRNIDMYIDFEMIKVKVPMKFLGTAGFSLRRDGHYSLSIQKRMLISLIAGII